MVLYLTRRRGNLSRPEHSAPMVDRHAPKR